MLSYKIQGGCLQITSRFVNISEDIPSAETDPDAYARRRMAEIEDERGLEPDPSDPGHVFISTWKLRTLLAPSEEMAFDNFEQNLDFTDDQKKVLRTITRRLDSVKDKEVDLMDPATIEGFQTLEALGILGPGRAAEVLAYRP